MLALVFVLGAGLFSENLAIVSHAESAAKVTASSAKIRKTADSSSEVIGSAAKDKAISIKSQTKGADLKEARANAYAATEWISFENKYMRHDIGKAIDEA